MGAIENHKKTWALVANGGRAKIVKYLGDVDAREVFEVNDGESNDGQVKAGVQLSGRPGRSFAMKGKSRSGLELHTDPVRNQERLFAEILSEYLLEKTSLGDIDSLVVVASPRTLGDLRKAFPKSLVNRVIRALDKDLTRLSEVELVERLLVIAADKRE